jgi:GTPase SAR1 family protein
MEHRIAKVVLVGDSGSGKSGLALRLANRRFAPTESTGPLGVHSILQRPHAEENERGDRTILLWDLPAAPGFGVLYPLHLDHAAVALIVFDHRGESDPVDRIKLWASILEPTARKQAAKGSRLSRFLIAARVDRGGLTLSHQRIEDLLAQFGFDGYFETSAKSDHGIAELTGALDRAIAWDRALKVVPQHRAILERMISERNDRGETFVPWPDLESQWIERTSVTAGSMVDGALAEFRAAVQALEIYGQAYQTPGGLVLGISVFDTCVHTLLAAAHNDVDGLGAVAEQKILQDTSATDAALVESIVALLLVRDLLVRVETSEGPFLVFPSEGARYAPALPRPEGAAVVFTFGGMADGLLSILVTQLAHSGQFLRREMWSNAATFVAERGGICGLLVRAIDHDRGEVTLFYDQATSDATRVQFEDHVQRCLVVLAAPRSIVRRSPFVCTHCSYQVPDDIVEQRREHGKDWLVCPVCDSRIWLREEAIKANAGFDVILLYNAADRDAVGDVAHELRSRRLRPWFDQWETSPGQPLLREAERAFANCRSVAVFVGQTSPGPWQDLELRALLTDSLERRIPIIPVLLPGANPRDLPLFLRSFTGVDLREERGQQLDRLVWGITGERPGPAAALAQHPRSGDRRQHALGLTRDEDRAVDAATEIRNTATLGVIRDLRRFARAVTSCLGAGDLVSVHIASYPADTTWEISLPKIGLRFTTQLAILLVRQAEDQGHSNAALDEYLRLRQPQFVLFVDIADGLSPPPAISVPVLRLDPRLLLDLTTVSLSTVTSWLGRVIAHQVDITPMLPYSTKGAATEMFFGREQELRRLLGKGARGGIILGVHGSGKSSLLHQLKKQLADRKRVVVEPITLTANRSRFFEQTLKGLQLPIDTAPTAATWAEQIRGFSRSSSPPVFLLDEADFLIRQDARPNSALGSEIRALQEERLAAFYLAGHLDLRAATLKYKGPFRNFAEEVTLKGLNEKAAIRLIREPILTVGFAIEESQARRIHRGTAGVASLIQEFCSRLLVAQLDAMATAITDEAIERVENDPSYLDQVFHYFYDYDETSLSRAVFLIVAIERRVNRAALTKILRDSRVRVSREQLDQSLSLLASFGILDEHSAGAYRLPALYLERAVRGRHPEGLLDEELSKLRRKR